MTFWSQPSAPEGTTAHERWKQIRRRLFPRSIQFTKQGKLYTAVTLGVGLAAVNTGNNLLFLVLGLMLGLIVVSGILSEMSLRGIEIKRRIQKHAEAEAVFPVELSIRNLKRFTSSYGIELRDEINGHPFRRRCFFLRVAPGEDRAVAYRCEIEKRGLARFKGTIVSTRFPFCLFEKSRFVPLEDDIIILPKTIPAAMPQMVGTNDDSVRLMQRAGQGMEFRELREMTSGDDPRRIDWRSTARLGRLMVRQNDVEGDDFIELVLDPAPAPGQDPERNIARAASVIRRCARYRVPTRLITAPLAVMECKEPFDCLKLLIHLALIDPKEAASAPPPLGMTEGAVLIGPRAGFRAGTDTARMFDCRNSNRIRT